MERRWISPIDVLPGRVDRRANNHTECLRLHCDHVEQRGAGEGVCKLEWSDGNPRWEVYVGIENKGLQKMTTAAQNGYAMIKAIGSVLGAAIARGSSGLGWLLGN